ncbi:PREDICTED: vomeronasal type-2 receptor 116-like [Chinchilla lanigera]|uniref:vomeronasal type-2 receptor 116-like n=1 Tax=Chinchilla lanigera TaxID=34839 RepID=UPI000698B380|nr:PREDICTED: vomeronasal type-2 receptor 116-like [Chinchilla lanigera]
MEMTTKVRIFVSLCNCQLLLSMLQVTFGSFDPTLTDSGQYPSLYQVAPRDTYLALGMVSLMLHFRWTWVGLLITEGQKGLQFLSDVRAEMDWNRVCVAFVKMISTLAVSYLSATQKHDIVAIGTSSVNVVVIYYDTDSTHDVNYNIAQNFVTWKVWVTNSQWNVDLTGRDFILDPFHGILVLSPHHEEISGFKNFVQEASPFRYPEDTYLVIYWSKNFHCSFSDFDCALKDCTPNASLAWLPPNRFDTAMSDRSYNIYNAVYAVAHALHAMLLEEVQRPPMKNRQVMMFSPWQLHRFLKNIQFNNPAGDQVNLDDRRKLDSEYDILNFWNFPEGLRLKVKVLVSECSLANDDCVFSRSTSVHKDGDLVVGAFFSLYSYTYFIEATGMKPSKDVLIMQIAPTNYKNVLTFIFAIEEINRNPHLLPNMSLGYEFHNIYYSHWRLLESFFILYTGQDEIPNYFCGRESKSVAVLTGTAWANAAQTGTLLELYKFPQFAFGSFDPVLSDNGQFPSLYQTAPKDTSLALGMVSLMLHFSWTWVGLVIAEGQKGLQFLSDVKREMDGNRVCVAFVKVIPSVLVSYTSVTKQHDFLSKETSPVNIVIIYFDSVGLNDMNYQVGLYLVTWRVWVTNSEWHSDVSGRNFIFDSFHGTLIFSQHHEEISGFKNFIETVNPSTYPEDTFLTLYWFQNFHCSFSDSDCALKDCTPNASLARLPMNRFDVAMSDGSYNTYNAVYAVAHALQGLLLQQVQMQPVGNWNAMVFSPWQLHTFLKELQFYNPAGDKVNLDKKSKVDAKYDILNFWNFPEGLRLRVKVGEFSTHAPALQQLSLFENMIEWATGITETPRSVCSDSCNPGFRKAPQEGKATCCFLCMPCAENEIANQTDMEQCVKCPDHQYASTQRNYCLQKSVTFLAYEDPLGKTLATTSLSLALVTVVVLGLFVKHRDTPIVKANNRALSYTLLISLTCCFLCSLLFIGRPSTATCILQQTTFAVVFTVAVSSVLAKTITVVLAFKVTAPGRRMRQLLVSGAPNSIIPICSLIQLTLCGVWMGTNPPYIDTDAHSEHGHILIVCNKGSLTAFYCVLGYLGSLALLSFTVAFLARNLPDTFNEAKFLTFSMLVFCSVWVTFLPVYHSTKGKVMVAMEVFSILASSAGLLGCIFAPKCYIILVRPKRNCLTGIRGKTHSLRKMPSY